MRARRLVQCFDAWHNQNLLRAGGGERMLVCLARPCCSSCLLALVLRLRLPICLLCDFSVSSLCLACLACVFSMFYPCLTCDGEWCVGEHFAGANIDMSSPRTTRRVTGTPTIRWPSAAYLAPICRPARARRGLPAERECFDASRERQCSGQTRECVDASRRTGVLRRPQGIYLNP